MNRFCIFILISLISTNVAGDVYLDQLYALSANYPDSAIVLYQTEIEIAKEEKNSEKEAEIYNHLGILYRKTGKFDEAIFYTKKALNLSKSEMIHASCYNNLGTVYRSLGKFEQGIESYILALKLYEKLNLKKEQATVTNNIGVLNMYMENYAIAKPFYKKAIAVHNELGNKKGISETLSNLAIIAANEDSLELSLDFFRKSYLIEKNLDDRKGIAESANNLGSIFYYLQNLDSSVHYFNESIKLEQAIGNIQGIGTTYNNLYEIYMSFNEQKKAKLNLDSGYHYSTLAKSFSDIKTALHHYSEFYQTQGNYQESLNYFKQYQALSDSILNDNTNKAVAQLGIQYETEKKEKEIALQKTLVQAERYKIKIQAYFMAILGLVLILVVITALFIYKQQRNKQKQLQRENELKDQLAQIKLQNKLHEERLRISRDLHDNIGSQLTFVVSSVDNLKFLAQKGEQKILDKLGDISNFTRSTISQFRDTIWAMNHENITLAGLHGRILNLIADAKQLTPDIQFNVLNNSTNYQLTAHQSINIYRIVQEAINNSIKYAMASEITVDISETNTSVEIAITDDGVGFDPKSSSQGNGLKNMKVRSAEIGAEIRISAEKEEKMIVKMVIPKDKLNDV